MFSSSLLKEIRLLIQFALDPQKHFEEMVKHFWKRPKPFRHTAAYAFTLGYFSSDVWVSPLHLVTVCNDICGYEVTIKTRSTKWLDCNPDAYGLSREQASKLMNAILSCVPGSVAYDLKQKGEIPC